MQELWQLYDEQGRPLQGQGANKDAVFSKGLLHGASHVWIWRKAKDGSEVLLQKRAARKSTWPNRYDISAAGHIDLDESPLAAALRETQEEIGARVNEADLKLISVQRVHMKAENGSIENEFQWLYLLELPINTEFNMEKSEVAALVWKSLETFKNESLVVSQQYVPHGRLYFETVTSAIELELRTLS